MEALKYQTKSYLNRKTLIGKMGNTKKNIEKFQKFGTECMWKYCLKLENRIIFLWKEDFYLCPWWSNREQTHLPTLYNSKIGWNILNSNIQTSHYEYPKTVIPQRWELNVNKSYDFSSLWTGRDFQVITQAWKIKRPGNFLEAIIWSLEFKEI